MATGYWTCEHLIYDKKTGELLTDRAWNYHVPLVKDIPIDFRVKLRPNSFNPVEVFGARSKKDLHEKTAKTMRGTCHLSK